MSAVPEYRRCHRCGSIGQIKLMPHGVCQHMTVASIECMGCGFAVAVLLQHSWMFPYGDAVHAWNAANPPAGQDLGLVGAGLGR